ncbi:bile acid:sodium symporter family protein [Parasphingorhabdus litoris]|nr:hypothetical protein [Parasphingorhabdus litoris]
MFGLGLSLRWEDFSQIAKFPGGYIAGLFGMLIAVPAFGLLLVIAFDVPPVLAMGVMLIATAPGGLFSNLITHMGGGNLALSIALTTTLSIIYIGAIPFVAGLLYMYFIGETAAIEAPVSAIALPLFFITLLPLTLGMFVTRFAENFAKRIQNWLRKASAIFIFAAFLALAFDQRDSLITSLQTVLLPVLLLNLGAITIGFLVTRLSRLNRADTIAVTIEHSVRQEGTAIYIAATVLGSAQMALPLILNGCFALSLSFLFTYWINKRSAKRIAVQQGV